jgi:hypothetical protein
MEKLIVNSRLLYVVGYDAKKGDLEITFRDGRACLYLAVPATVYLALMNAESKGDYFNQEIKDRYVFRPLNPSA